MGNENVDVVNGIGGRIDKTGGSDLGSLIRARPSSVTKKVLLSLVDFCILFTLAAGHRGQSAIVIIDVTETLTACPTTDTPLNLDHRNYSK